MISVFVVVVNGLIASLICQAIARVIPDIV
jgi:hypothetical protein